jgi:hypothetical protein
MAVGSAQRALSARGMALSWGFGGFAKRIYIGNVFAATDRSTLLGQSGNPCMAVTLLAAAAQYRLSYWIYFGYLPASGDNKQRQGRAAWQRQDRTGCSKRVRE